MKLSLEKSSEVLGEVWKLIRWEETFGSKKPRLWAYDLDVG